MAAVGKEGHSSQLQLADLPDEIIIHILSLLPETESAVWTCLLVLRRSGQQHLWKSLTNLKFNYNHMTSLIRESNFINFVDIVLDLRDHSVPLESFSLRYFFEKEEDVIRTETLITKAVQSSVEELTLNLHNSYSYFLRTCLPICMFGCQSLVKLDLQFITFDVPSSVICLPRLKYLRLYDVILVNGESTEMLFSSPLLEELIIDQCSLYRIESIRVSSPKLQVLKIWDDDDSSRNTKIFIAGDNLKYFSYKGGLLNEMRICASSSTQLTKVEIYVYIAMFRDLCVNCYDILKGLYGTRNLALTDYFLEGLQNISELLDTIPVFECLTRLDIRVYKEKMSIDSSVLMKMYERCPHLEYLNIEKLSNTKGNQQLSSIPLCFQTSLKKILVHYYVPGDKKANNAIDVLLKSALVLEELVIYCVMDQANRFHQRGHKIQKLQDRFNRRPRVSKGCIISVRESWWPYHDRMLC